MYVNRDVTGRQESAPVLVVMFCLKRLSVQVCLSSSTVTASRAVTQTHQPPKNLSLNLQILGVWLKCAFSKDAILNKSMFWYWSRCNMLLQSTKWNGNFGKTNLAASFWHIMYRNWGRAGRIGWGNGSYQRPQYLYIGRGSCYTLVVHSLLWCWYVMLIGNFVLMRQGGSQLLRPGM